MGMRYLIFNFSFCFYGDQWNSTFPSRSVSAMNCLSVFLSFIFGGLFLSYLQEFCVLVANPLFIVCNAVFSQNVICIWTVFLLFF